jgi:DNA-binding MarR family transcriptional regulator
VTDVERNCLDAVLRLSRGDVAPTYAELAKALGCGKTSVYRAVHSLIAQGFVEKTPGKARSVRVVRSTGIGLHIHALIRQYGGAVVAAEVARQLGLEENSSALPVYGEGGPPLGGGRGETGLPPRANVDGGRRNLRAEFKFAADQGGHSPVGPPPTTLCVVPPPRKRGGPSVCSVRLFNPSNRERF